MDIKTVSMDPTRLQTALSETAAKVGSSATRQVNAFLTFGFVMVKMTAETQEHPMNIQNKDVMSRLVIQVSSSVLISSAFCHHFIVMEMMTVEMHLTNLNTVSTQSVRKISFNA
jgi:hypothetical protein